MSFCQLGCSGPLPSWIPYGMDQHVRPRSPLFAPVHIPLSQIYWCPIFQSISHQAPGQLVMPAATAQVYSNLGPPSTRIDGKVSCLKLCFLEDFGSSLTFEATPLWAVV